MLDKILPYEARAEFCQIFRSFFWAMEFQQKMLLRFTNLYPRMAAALLQFQRQFLGQF